jgi:transposase
MKQDTLVVGGVDAHADSHHAAVLDRRGALLGAESFPTTTPGYGQLLDWLCAFGEVDVVAVESTGSYAAALVRYLRERGVRVLEVNQPHAHTRRRRGKSDPIDAELAARLALAGKATTVPKQTDGIVESIRLLRAARQSAVKSRSAAMVQLGGLIVTAPQELRDQLSCRKTIRGKAALCRRLRPSTSELRRPTHAAKFALRSIAGAGPGLRTASGNPRRRWFVDPFARQVMISGDTARSARPGRSPRGGQPPPRPLLNTQAKGMR